MPRIPAPEPPGEGRKSAFLSRYGATILRGGIATIPTALFTYGAILDLSPQETWFISYILAHKWDEDLPYPSLRKMAERTGLSVRQLHRIKDSIIDKGYLALVPRHRASDGGQDSNAYDFSGLFARLEELLRSEGRAVAERQAAPYSDAGDPPDVEPRAVAAQAPPVKQARVPARAAQPPVTQTAAPPVTPTTPAPESNQSPTPVTSMTSAPVTWTAPDPVTPPTTPPVPTESLAPVTAPAPARMSAMSPEKKQRQESLKTDDSNQLSPFVMAVASDLTRELGDAVHEGANMVQANRLWNESALPEEAFVALMQEARQRTRRAQGGQGNGNIANRAAYFFQVLRTLVQEVRDAHV